MSRNNDVPVLEEDPRQILGVSVDAGEEEIRTSYVRKIKEYPPDRSPAEFERVRDAYEALRDPRSRMRMMLQSVDPEAPLVALLDSHRVERRFVGPKLWLDAMRD